MTPQQIDKAVQQAFAVVIPKFKPHVCAEMVEKLTEGTPKYMTHKKEVRRTGRRVRVDGVEYDSIVEAAKNLRLHKTTLHYWLRKGSDRIQRL